MFSARRAVVLDLLEGAQASLESKIIGEIDRTGAALPDSFADTVAFLENFLALQAKRASSPSTREPAQQTAAEAGDSGLRRLPWPREHDANARSAHRNVLWLPTSGPVQLISASIVHGNRNYAIL